jgi:hypothetical protein
VRADYCCPRRVTGGCLLPNPPQRAGHMFAPTSGWPAPPERPPGLVASGRSQLLTSTASTNRQIQHAHPGRRSSNRQACAIGS